MSTQKAIRAAQSLLRQVSRMTQSLTKGLVSWLLRSLLIIGRQPLSRAGFVLPTTVLLLLVVVLTVGAISYRTFTRTQQAATERQQQVVYNAATPAIDRAKSKLEFLFDPNKDSRAGGVPSQTQLLGMMLNDERDLGNGVIVTHFPDDKSVDPYTLDGEERIDINGDGKKDNAWRYRVDLDGDGNVSSPGNKDGWAVYSILFTAPSDSNSLRDARTTAWQTRANALQVRNAPLSNASQSNNICQRNDAANAGTPLVNGDGWFPDQRNTTKIRKNFQVSAYVVPDNPTGTVATLEFQQDREATQGFKWAAWFRNDLEIFPGPRFNWNGAMHTEGSLIIGGSSFRGYLVSSPQSCINSSDASEITARLNSNPTNDTTALPDFRGRFITGTIRDNNFSGSAIIDTESKNPDNQQPAMGVAQDSVAPGSLKPIDFSLEPVVLQTTGRSKPRNSTVTSANFQEGTNWTGGQLNKGGQGRVRNIDKVTTPYVDDTFRADNRWGPKPTWGPQSLSIGILDENDAGSATAKIGDLITGAPILTGSDPTPGSDSASVGLDGYWERRARVDGLRLIVGQRLELGDPAGWGGPGSFSPTGGGASIALTNEPLRPWQTGCSGITCNEERQRKALWDNLAAVQSTAIYHNATDTTADARDFPDACLVTTVHPGTPTTLDRSSTFEQLAYGIPKTAFQNAYGPEEIISDFFRGRGTNGWEFSTPTAADFKNPNSALMTALRNLAYFAGDPYGGTPSFKPEQQPTGQVHPYPSMAMWGDFSNLRRVFQDLLEKGATYDSLSPADKTTLHTAACTLGMLAYNLDYLEKLKVYDLSPASDPTRGTGVLQSLSGFTDDEINPAGLTITNNLLGNTKYSAGLRGRIRVIDHIAKGYINATNVTNIPVDQRPPTSLITSMADLMPPTVEPSGGMNLLVWDANKSNNPETYVRLLERWRDDSTTSAVQKDELNKIISLAQLIITKEQVARDRTWGFRGNYGGQTIYSIDRLVSTGPLGDCGFSLDATNKTPFGGWLLNLKLPFSAKNLNNGVTDSSTELVDPFYRLCSSRPRYPILYSLFPAKLQDAITAVPADLNTAYAGGFKSHQDISDPTELGFTRDDEDSKPLLGKFITNENSGRTYAVVRPSAVATRPLRINQSGITLGTAGTAWTLPTDPGSPGTGTTPNSNQFNLIKACNNKCSEPNNANSTTFQAPKVGTLIRVAFKDGAFFNGREMLPVRTLDLDLDLMRSKSYSNDWWLPKKGIVYAFREDAVSESTIVRPNSGNTWLGCDTDAELKTVTCAMRTGDVSAFNSKDPPLNDKNSITPKAVDYYADPDRRPHGFRLRQGASLKRDGDEGRGLSLISDNPVYVQGNFNLHQQGGTRLEEFTPSQFLAFNADGSYSNFYDRTDLDLSFADRNKDEWRPSEVVADAVTLISSNFCDGSIEDTFASAGATSIPAWLRTRYGCGASASVTSYLNQNRPEVAITGTDTTSFTKGAVWVRTNLIDNFPRAMVTTRVASGRNYDEGESPMFVARQGRPAYWGDISGNNKVYDKTYMDMSDNKQLIGATDNTRMNLILVSGLVPSREGQSYGGLHNFPRFLESWSNLFISGAFLQLNFSNYATAPFDQENWQIGSPDPTTGSGANEWIRYYSPPNRRWGYDVALQYAPAGPVAQRFQFAEDTRSEFYSEPPANDPYIRNLCKQVPGKAATCPT